MKVSDYNNFKIREGDFNKMSTVLTIWRVVVGDGPHL